MRWIFLLYALLLSTLSYSQTEDIKLRAYLKNTIDSLFIIVEGCKYCLADDDTIDFGLIMSVDSLGLVTKCQYILLNGGKYEKTINVVCNYLLGVNLFNYCEYIKYDDMQYPKEIKIRITSEFLKGGGNASNELVE